MRESKKADVARRLAYLPLLMGLALLVAACGSSDSNGNGTLDFGQFVTGLLQFTNDTSEPIETNSLNFAFSEDPNQFNNQF